ncbi:AAA family ATPase [Ralstonia pickettii]|uniref:ATP-dependent nuclease n=1 Tax=Ralstonia pickettii TaxID=329 RepID=UPI000D5D6467|nr:ATP-binding protein [Ralstonia pickettii]NYS09582.1 AAA family ATPase [Ralstonia pickettii]
MRVNSLQVRNFRSFEDSGAIDFDSINVLVGANNAGKSSILRGLYHVQEGLGVILDDVRVGSNVAYIDISISDARAQEPFQTHGYDSGRLTVSIIRKDDVRGGGANITFRPGESDSRETISFIKGVDPHHFVVPYLSKRKTAVYSEDVRHQSAMQVFPNMGNLAAKLSRISNRSFPEGDAYAKACEEILGFVVTAIPSENGQRPGIYLPNREVVPIDQMGEGVPNIVALLVDLTLSSGKLFLVEEPENDLHPEALKALLDLMIDASKRNQFVVSTHSNIVVRHLGAAPNSKVFHVSAQKGRLPTTATIEQVPNTPQARLNVLRELGYSFTDFDLWSGWLIVEESSAERVIRDYLIPWFAPKLSRMRTLSANGTGNVEATFADFDRLMRFAHLEPIYSKAAWVRVDADPSGKEVVEKLRNSYKTWDAAHFDCFSKEQFEHYYPAHFAEKVDQVLAVRDRQAKRVAKRELLDEVRHWLDEDEERGRTALAASAKDVIEELQRIEALLQ